MVPLPIFKENLNIITLHHSLTETSCPPTSCTVCKSDWTAPKRWPRTVDANCQAERKAIMWVLCWNGHLPRKFLADFLNRNWRLKSRHLCLKLATLSTIVSGDWVAWSGKSVFLFPGNNYAYFIGKFVVIRISVIRFANGNERATLLFGCHSFTLRYKISCGS